MHARVWTDAPSVAPLCVQRPSVRHPHADRTNAPLGKDHSLSGGPKRREVNAKGIPSFRASERLPSVVEPDGDAEPLLAEEPVPPQGVFNHKDLTASGLDFISPLAVDGEAIPCNE